MRTVPRAIVVRLADTAGVAAAEAGYLVHSSARTARRLRRSPSSLNVSAATASAPSASAASTGYSARLRRDSPVTELGGGGLLYWCSHHSKVARATPP